MTAPQDSFRLEFHDNGFTAVFGRHEKTDVAWEQVREIVAFRRDPGGSDVLCLGFRWTAANEYLEIHEEHDDYETLLEKMYEALPKLDRQWWQQITETYGANRTTIFGLPLADQLHKDSPTVRFLLEAKKRKLLPRTVRRNIRRAAVAVILAAGVQQLLAWAIAQSESANWDDILAMTLLPMLLIVGVCRFWPGPRKFFLLLGGFHLAEWLVSLLIGAPCLAGKLLDGQISYLLLLGLEILVGMGVMLLPDKRVGRMR
jgi:hypothetical protein